MTRRTKTDDLYEMAFPSQPEMSPDGRRIVYTLRTADREADRNLTSLWQVDTGGGEARQLTRGTADSSPAWSPDGTTIAFLRDGDIWLLPADGGEPRPVTTGGAGAPVWSPDGTRIAFATAVGPDEPERPLVIDRLGHKADGVGLIGLKRRHIHVLDVATGKIQQITSGDWHAGEPAWSPDGTRIAFRAEMDADADLTYRSAAYVVEIGGQPRMVGGGEGRCETVGWTTDGRALLVVGRTTMTVGNSRLLKVPLDGGETIDLAESLDRNVTPGVTGYPGALPQPVGDTVYFCARDRGYTHLYAVEDAKPRLVFGGAGNVVSGVDIAGGKAAIVLATPSAYAEIAVVGLASGDVEVRTSHGPTDVELFPYEEREFTVSDGTVVHGWLLRDPDRKGPLPLLLDIHGGPHNAYNATADPARIYRQVLAERGWAVLLLNPRASDGYGEAFLTAAIGAWGSSDAKDFLEPLDHLVAEGVADQDRLAVCGYSYGGYMTCYLTSRDSRFARAVAGGLVCDLTSMTGTSDAGHYLATQEFRGATDANPLARVDDVRTPTLILHGGDDDRCPVGQAEQWFTALHTRGVPTQMVLYPDASHLFIVNGRPSHRVDYSNRIVDWVEQRQRVRTDHWRRRLAELCRKHHVPGAALGILRGDELAVASFGVLDKGTGAPVADDSVFQIGSVTKVWTTTLIMQLVEEGKLDLDAPVADVLPDLRLSDPGVAERVTLRHLLTHTSGIDGDHFVDTGRGDDCLEKYVDGLDQAAQVHPLGATMSYCNSGFVLAGRVIEQVTGQSWDAVLRARLIEPLGLKRTVTLPEEAIVLGAAVGHEAAAGQEPQPVKVFMLTRSLGPAGLITASAADLLAFARMHLDGGAGLLGEAATAAMTEWQVDVPNQHTTCQSWGLGWMRFDWGSHGIIGHDGSTRGQAAFLRIVPELDLAITLLTNGGNTADLFQDLFGELFAELAGIAVPAPVQPPARPPTVDADRHLGVYERAGARVEIFRGDNGLRIRFTATGLLADIVPEPVQEHDLLPVTDTLFVYRPEDKVSWSSLVFYTLPTGEPYVQIAVRSYPKV
ncbi:serine hydrolase [Kutzneria sp. CA-103260]|uniref:serine hydrolase n=1 Tax=Kutzneria sp. CA-103260 TaxID=2802641 RepID=UPI001BA4A430|nr:serine hydrolase [Kutzneria sp. CA-103260]QUQ65186.1 beta-lactamase/prolyl oligopeptidase [Kutzneria sp. CA-103260]